MPKYRIIGTDIRHGGEVHPEGSTIELEEAEAAELKGFVFEVLDPAEKADTKKGGKN